MKYDPLIIGFIETSAETIHYADVLGIYADRATPTKPVRRPGYWVKIYDSDAPKGLYKIYVEELSVEQYNILQAAARFNQAINRFTMKG